MDWKRSFISYIFIIIMRRAWSTKLLPPEHTEIKSSVLSWTSSGSEENVTYTVQYSTLPEQTWHQVCGCNQLQFNFTADSEDFYGKKFRIRAERANQTSDWKESEQVQCQHIDVCAPLLNLTVKPDKVLLWMDHRDSSLEDHNGFHIKFHVLYWKVTSVSDKKELPANGKTMLIDDLESGQEYCFQVVYLRYKNPYGNPSRLLCKVIPETSAERNHRYIIVCLLLGFGLALIGTCLYFVYKNYKRIKTFLQPPLDIPEHFQEFFSGEFSQHELICHSSQRTDSENLITIALEEDGEAEEAEVI